jgi:hypothetical protein
MVFIYEAIRAALTLVLLHEIPHALQPFLDHLDRANEKTRPRQLERFRDGLQPETG